MSTTTTSSRVSPASEAWGLMHELFLSHKGRFMAAAAEFELSPPQMGALQSIDPDKPIPMSELASVLHCDNSNVTGIVDRLEDRGLVERRPAPHDRRLKLVVLTETGAEVRARVRERLSVPHAAIASLSVEDQRALRDVLRRALGR
jgi:DNA-binding MarR family transcriptional regulator